MWYPVLHCRVSGATFGVFPCADLCARGEEGLMDPDGRWTRRVLCIHDRLVTHGATRLSGAKQWDQGSA